jgi:hypothetical protein
MAAPAAIGLDAMLSAQTVWRAGHSPHIASGGVATGHAALDALLPQGGWPRGALTELLLPADGVGEVALLLPTLARLTQAGDMVVLVAPPYLPYAPAWQAAGVDLRQLEIVEADARGALWAFEQCLRSAACAAVLGWPLQVDGPSLRRLQVAADSGDCLGFAFRDRKHAGNPSPAALRLEHVPGAPGRVGPGAVGHGLVGLFDAERDAGAHGTAGQAQGAWHVRKCRGGQLPSRPFVPSAAPAMPFAVPAVLANALVH